MADVDDLDTISDADLRARMLAQGLPNIPITSNSRKVLVKRLRASLRGQASPAVVSSSKTLKPSAAAPAAASTPMHKPKEHKDGPASRKSRRPVAPNKKDTKAADRRRSEELVFKKPVVGALTRARRSSQSQCKAQECTVVDSSRKQSYESSALPQSYVAAEAPSLASTSSYRRSPPRQPFVYDLSDDNGPDDVPSYASAFTRNLARQRSERIRLRNSSFGRRTLASTRTMGYGRQARRSLPPDEDSVYMSPKSMFILCVFILLIGVYRFFTRD